jgi:ribonuclease T2
MDQPFRTVLAVFTGLISFTWGNTAGAQSPDFDFYVLSLSWSPTYCATQQGGRGSRQCDGDEAHAFVVHGLWPQFETGYPEFCRSSEPQRVPQTLGEALFDIMPSMGLIGHQWRKHGSCTGLTQRDYLAETRKAFERVRIPEQLAEGARHLTLSADEIESAFVSANPGMTAGGVAASCEGRQLEEIRICLTKDLQFRDCAEVDRRGCRRSQIDVPPAE